MATQVKDRWSSTARARATLPTHVRPPKQHAGLLSRPALTGRLVEAALTKRLVLVTAPSGFGKTTLLGDAFRALEGRDVLQIWLSVTDTDRDPAFLGRLLVDQLAERCGTPAREGEDFAAYAHRVAYPATALVIIDNWNFIECDATNRYFDRLMTETEGIANFVVASRTLPGFLFETYKLAGTCALFGVHDLAFSPQEACAFLNRHTTALPAPALRVLIARTEGWPAAIQLLRLALDQVGGDAAAEFNFSGSRADVADYLNKTLFRHLPPERRSLLCNLAVLDHITRDLAVEITGDPRAGADFSALARDSIFLTETSEGSQRYRFHSLLRDFLLSQHAREATLPQGEILRRASIWHAAREEIEYAIPYAIRAGERARAKALLEDYVHHRLIADGKVFLFSEWVSALKRTGETLSPLLKHWYLWSLVFSGRWRTALAIQTADPAPHEAMIDATIAAFSDDQQALSEAVEKWTTDSAAGDPFGVAGDPFSIAVMRAAAALADMARGQLAGAAQNILRAKFTVEPTGSDFGRTWVLTLCALLSLMKGRICEAELEIEDAIRLSECMTAPMARMTHMLAAIVTYHRGADARALAHLAEAQRSTEDYGLPFIVAWSASVARSLRAPSGMDQQAAPPDFPTGGLIGLAQRIEAMMQKGASLPQIEDRLRTFEAHIAVAREKDPDLLIHGWVLRDFHTALNARLALLRGDAEGALRILGPAIAACQRDGRGLIEQKFMLLRVAALIQQNQRPAALRFLIRTAESAVRYGLWRFFLDDRRLIEPLLPALFDAGKRAPLGDDANEWRAFTRALGHEDSVAVGPAGDAPPADAELQVTAREAEMLRFLEMGLSNKEIGERLGIRVPTVKWHLHNLFAKINVRNRSSAVRYARDNRLI